MFPFWCALFFCSVMRLMKRLIWGGGGSRSREHSTLALPHLQLLFQGWALAGFLGAIRNTLPRSPVSEEVSNTIIFVGGGMFSWQS
jgi:hypothetical protein